ncbi:YbjN domain-containing protein [Aeromonas jandaei]
MTSQFFLPTDISAEAIHQLFESAYMDSSIDEDNDVIIKERFRCFIRISEDKSRVSIFSIFTGNEELTIEEKINFVNNINQSYYFIKAIAMNDGHIRFEYDLDTKGGLTPKNIVFVIKRYHKVIESIIDSGDYDNIFN